MPKDRLIREILPRAIADTISINAALVSALVVHFLYHFWGVRASVAGLALVDLSMLFDASVRMWELSATVISAVSLIVFWFSGLYTFGRAFRSRYKALMIVDAVTLSYLISIALVYLVFSSFLLHRDALIMAWAITLAYVGGTRMFKALVYLLFPRAGERERKEIEKILVIGGAGYIGSALVQRLLELGYKVRVLDTLLYGDTSLSSLYTHPSFELVQGDFRCIPTVVSAAKGMDAIVHLGAIVGDSACTVDENLTIEINLRATKTIAEVGKGFGVKRFVFASTCSVYGASNEWLDERSALCPLSLYARTKVESEKVLLSLADADFAPTILRFGTIYGLSGRPRFDLVVNLLTAKAIQDGEAGIFGGSQWRPLVHVKDVAEAIILTLQAPLHNVRGQIFNVGSNEQNYQMSDLGPMIHKMVPAARIVTRPSEDNRNYRVRFDKIERLLNFQPRYTVRDGIQELIDAFATGKITDYRDPHYNNFSFLKLNGELRHLFVEDVGGWDWVKLSAEDAMMLTEVVMAVIESQSQALMGHLRASLVQAILGDVDGFLNSLTGVLPTSRRPDPIGLSLDRQPESVKSGLEPTPLRLKRVLA